MKAPMPLGHAFERRVTLTEHDLTDFAERTGDANPLHHDRAFAEGTRFGGLIASGAHPVALMVALCGAQATEFPGVGLEFNFRLLGAVRPGELVIRWEVVASEPKPKLRGHIISLAGSACDADGKQLVEADAKILTGDLTAAR